ncbi:MAG: hypothetical protein HZA46_17610 [Planctomycetales bacterium]|nr:hypothetical protein [Planctomycetales bacterium]
MIRSRLLFIKHLVYAVCVLVLACVLTEIGLRVYDSMTGQITRKETFDRGLVCKSWHVHHELKPSQRLIETDPDSGQSVEVLTNSLGLRGPEIAVPKPPGVYRIVCLGDEATLAPKVAEADTFCARLQQTLQSRSQIPIEVLNAGVPGDCPLLAYLRLRRSLVSLQPDLVLMNFDMSDVADDYRYRRHTVLDSHGVPLACSHPDLEMPRHWVKSNPRVDQLDTEEFFLLPQWGKQNLGWMWKEQVQTNGGPSSPQARYAWLDDHPSADWSMHVEQAFEPLRHLADLAHGVAADFAVVTYPVPWQVSLKASNGDGVRRRAGVPDGAIYPNRRPFDQLTEFCRDHQLPLLDTSPKFQNSNRAEQLYFHNAPQFSPDGHDAYAAELALFLIQNLRGPWSEGATAPSSPLLPEARVLPKGVDSGR